MSRRGWLLFAVVLVILAAIAYYAMTRPVHAPGADERRATEAAAGPPSTATSARAATPKAAAPPGGTAGITATNAVTTTGAVSATNAARPPESTVRPIALDGPLGIREAEISGLAWFSDTLVLLPQYPGRFGYDGTVVTTTQSGEGTLFGVGRANVEAALVAGEPSVAPQPIPLAGAGFGKGEARAIPGFEGFEAIAFAGRTAYLSIEVQNGDDMAAYIVRGTVDVDADGVPIGITIDAGEPTEVPLPLEIDNMSMESLVADADGVTAFFEANGSALNPSPTAFRLGPDLAPQGQVTFPSVEYRLTDASEAAADGSFWMTNYMFPGDAETLHPADDGIAGRWGEGATHAAYAQVERIVRIERLPPSDRFGAGYRLADEPPVQLELVDGETSRNWEGLAALGDAGFLVVTDKFPSTILAFVAAPH